MKRTTNHKPTKTHNKQSKKRKVTTQYVRKKVATIYNCVEKDSDTSENVKYYQSFFKMSEKNQSKVPKINPVNLLTGHYYSYNNAMRLSVDFHLNVQRDENDSFFPAYLTFQQAKQLNGHVKKGEKSRVKLIIQNDTRKIKRKCPGFPKCQKTDPGHNHDKYIFYDPYFYPVYHYQQCVFNDMENDVNQKIREYKKTEIGIRWSDSGHFAYWNNLLNERDIEKSNNGVKLLIPSLFTITMKRLVELDYLFNIENKDEIFENLPKEIKKFMWPIVGLYSCDQLIEKYQNEYDDTKQGCGLKKLLKVDYKTAKGYYWTVFRDIAQKMTEYNFKEKKLTKKKLYLIQEMLVIILCSKSDIGYSITPGRKTTILKGCDENDYKNAIYSVNKINIFK